ncbi:AMP-binding protein, partial [Pyrobaculum aerophilum]|uniref:AMP-binding protein n=1 Tax=Pyrobaculum aerophilum TaxID=13773 RepID=UPI0023F2621F
MNSYKNTLTLNNLLKFIVNVFPDYPVIYKAPHGYEIRSTYREEYEHILRIANALKSLGLGRGDRVATLDWNTIWHFRLYWAVPLMGAVLHQVNVRLSIEDIIYIINKAEDKVIIYHRDFSDIIEKIKNKLHNVRYYIQIPDGLEPKTSDMTIDELEKSGKAEPLPDVDEDLIATINFTSGTTGKPKGAYFTHKQHVIHAMANAIVGSYKGFMRCECQEKLCKFLVLVPMFHVHAWGKPYSFGLQGVGQVYPGRFNTTHIIKLIVEEEIKYMEGVPTILYMLLTDKTIETYREDIKKIRPIFTVGGAALPRELAKKAEEYGFEVRVGYGMTVTAPVLLVNYLRPHENIPLSEEERYNFLTATGLPIPLVDLMVVDENLNPVPR